MPHPDPRQLLIREALLGASIGVIALAVAGWWAVRQPTAPQALADHAPALMTNTPAATPPTACLWSSLCDAPEVATTAAPPPPPAMRLISLSKRDDRWIALIDPGDGSASQRVAGGEDIAGWKVESVGQNIVELSAGGRRHQLKFGP